MEEDGEKETPQSHNPPRRPPSPAAPEPVPQMEMSDGEGSGTATEEALLADPHISPNPKAQPPGGAAKLKINGKVGKSPKKAKTTPKKH